MARRQAHAGEGQIDMVTAQFSEPGVASVNLEEQARYLAEATVHFDTVAASEPFLRAAQNDTNRVGLESRYGKNTDAVIGGFQTRHDDALVAAHTAFGNGFGRYALLDSGFATEETVNGLIDPEFARFSEVFRGDTRAPKRDRYRYYLATRLADPQAIPAELMGPEIPKAVINLTGRVALSHLLRPEFIGLQRSDFTNEIADKARAYTPQRLHGALFGQTRREKNALGYYLQGERSKRFVTVQSSEWDILIRSTPGDLAQAAINRADNKLRRTPVELEADEDAPRRAGLHIVEQRRDKMENYHVRVIKPYIDLLNRFGEAARFGGNLMRFGNEANARQYLAMLQTFVLGDMFWAVASQQPYNRRVAAREIEQSVQYAIYSPADSQVRLKNFYNIAKLAHSWYSARSELYTDRIAQADNYLLSNMTEEERAAKTA